MIIPLSHSDWQVLRAVLRAEAVGGPPPLGRELRLTPSRKTKDGTFLDALVEEGLLAVAEKAGPPRAERPRGESPEPAQFRTRYRLTEMGRHAAEYGEYDRPHTPKPAPLSGVAAELASILAQQNGSSRASSRGKGRGTR